jgi:hypothetical protein
MTVTFSFERNSSLAKGFHEGPDYPAKARRG